VNNEHVPSTLTDVKTKLVELSTVGDSVVGITNGYGVKDRRVGVRIQVGSTISSSRGPDELWSPPRLLSDGYRASFSGGKAAGAITHLQLVLRSRKCGPIQPLPHTSSWCSA
jgi:hypothetical protein